MEQRIGEIVTRQGRYDTKSGSIVEVWGCGRLGVWEIKTEEGGWRIEWVSIRLAMLDHLSSILKPSPTLPHIQPPTLSQTTTTLPDWV